VGDHHRLASVSSLRPYGQPRTQPLEIKAACAQLLPTRFADHLDLAICFVFNCLGSVRFMNVINHLFLCSPQQLQILRYFGPRFKRCVLLDYMATTSAQFDLDQHLFLCSPQRLQILRYFGPRFKRCVLLDYLATTSAQFDLDQQHVKRLHSPRPPLPPAPRSIAGDRCPFPRP
jgi:hypothetical protein